MPSTDRSNRLNLLTLDSIKRVCLGFFALLALLFFWQNETLADLNRNATPIGDEAWPSSSLAWADWDGDGDLDLAIGNRGQPIQIYENEAGRLRFDLTNSDPAQRFGWQATQAFQTSSLAWGDWDWDGDPDLAVGNDGQPNQVYQNDGGQLTLAWQAPQANNTTAIAWGDWSGGNMDLAVANAGQPNQIYQNDEGVLRPVWQSPQVDNSTAIAWGDWNGDGRPDLAVGNRGQPNRVYQSEGASFSLAWQAPDAESTTAIAWGDWNDDGRLDLAVGNDGRPNRIYQNSGGQFVSIWQSPDSSRTTSIAWGDWNGDGRRDLAVGNLGQANQVFEHTDSNLTLAWQSSDRAQTTAIAWGAINPQNGHDLAAANDGQENQLYAVIAPITSFALSRFGLTEQDNRPLLRTDVWQPPGLCAPGRCGGGKDLYLRNFAAPTGAVEVEIDAYWVWDGGFIGQEQNEESFFVLAAGQEGFCEDRGNGPVPSDEALCWQTTFARANDLEITLRHAVEAGQEETAESVKALVEVRWYGAPQTPACNSVDLSIASGSRIPPNGATTDVVVDGSNASRYRVVQLENDGSASPVTGEQTSNQFTAVPVSPGETYQAQAGDDAGQWSSAGCRFQYNLQVQAATGTATCTGGSVANPNPFPITVVYSVDGLARFQGQVPANTTQPVIFSFNDGAFHSAQFTWSGNGQNGTVNLGTFGPCGAATPAGTATCNGGSVTNPNPFPLNITYTVDGVTQFSGQIAANTTQTINYTFNDGATHTAQFSWNGNGQNGTVNLGTFGPCGAATPTGTATCTGGSIANPNSFPINVTYTVDGVTQFSGQVAANTTQTINYTFNDGATHTAQFSWNGNGQNGIVSLGSFGPCGATAPIGATSCNGGSVTNPNSFPINVVYTVDGVAQFSGQIAANTTQTINYTFNDGALHAAQFTWSGNGLNGTVNLGTFGPCSAAAPNGTATCNGGSVSNPNAFAIDVTYTVDGLTIFQGQVPANSTQPVNYTFNDGAIHNAQFTWSGNNQNGTVSLGSFGPCGAVAPTGSATCTGGAVTNPNPFPIDVVYTVDGQTRFQGQVAANTTQPVTFSFNDGAMHTAQFTWSGNSQNGTVDLGAFGPCGAAAPAGTATCNGGSVTNPNPFPIDVVYTIDGQAVFQNQIPANTGQVVVYGFNDGAVHSAQFTWSGNSQTGTVDLGAFGPCGAAAPAGTASCDGGSITNPNTFSIDVVYTIDGLAVFQGQMAANTTQAVDFTFSDGLIHNAQFTWSGNSQNGTVDLGAFGPCGATAPTGTASCDGGSVTNPNGFPIQVVYYVDDVVVFNGLVPANSTIQIRYTFQDSAIHTARFTWSGNGAGGAVDLGSFGPCAAISGQYQDFIGPVPFGTYTPYREPGKEYFLGPRSLMYNVEYLAESGEGEVVFRFNGRELPGITTSLFNNGNFSQIEDERGRGVTQLETGTTKLIAYRFGLERARIFQTFWPGQTRWLHPLDQPFEHKARFQLEVHGPPASIDLLVYGDLQQPVSYDKNGRAIIELTYGRPGLAALYPPADALNWLTVDALRPTITRSQTISYTFAESGLYHYRMLDAAGQMVAGPIADSFLTFEAQPGQVYHPQLVYPQASLFVALYEAMAFKHPSGWLMPVDARREHAFEFHLDYHRLPDPDLDNPHIRGDVVVDALYLLNATTSVAQQFPYGRHDGALPGVKLVGIPNVSLVAFCVRPGMHEVVFWGGWENESYYLPEQGRIVDQNLYDAWSTEQRNDCIDAARRVNMLLAQEGLRTDHTYHHHGQASQGFQMSRLGVWSPYNLVGLRPPHAGKLLRPGTVLTYYQAPEAQLFWGWDLEAGGLRDGLGAADLQKHIESLGPVDYIDQTGLHPASRLNP